MKAILSVAAFAIAMAGSLSLPLVAHLFTKETVSGAVIEEKERVTKGDTSRFMVWTDREVFENTDTLLAMKFNSADLHGQLKVGSTCDLKVVGWRLPLLSWNRNILEADCK